MTRETLTGHELREMFAAASRWLEKSVPEIDALNVFPVPDGDTGTNMFLTMRSTVEDAFRAPEAAASAVAGALAHGALMGARGNSGVILSQIFRGLAEALSGKDSVSPADLAGALRHGANMAYRGLANPVEGTMLTVIKDAARAADEAARNGNDVEKIMEAAVNAARDSVADTPRLLPVLREAGVVDAGGQGVYTILDGALRYLRGEVEEMEYRKPLMVASSVPYAGPSRAAAEEVPFGYCTEFLIQGKRLKPEAIQSRLRGRGQSLIVVGDESTVRVHIHTDNPGVVIRYGTLQGTLHQVSVRNMDEQHRDFLEMQKGKVPEVDMGVVAVVSGDGLAEVFRSLGAAAIVPGGRTMNPSTKDLVQAVESVPARQVFILPNDKNVIATARQVQALTRKNVAVVPTATLPQGITALLAFSYDADFEANGENMAKAASAVRTISITRAVRSTQLDGLKIRKRQLIAFLNGDLVSVGDEPAAVLEEVLGRLDMEKAEVLTIYHGDEATEDEARAIGAGVREKYGHLEVEVVRGGQPHYNYIISVE